LEVNIDDVEPAVLARCTLAQLEERLARFGILMAAAFVVSDDWWGKLAASG